ncbi:MAG TPA: 5'-nucleotidase C-terminal domain-containing protein [Gemmatimonadaceae bacterium]|nr:5'-nucleotidase C-terminal domain-containing protein [Gemmatimonadaceae bacterium]
MPSRPCATRRPLVTLLGGVLLGASLTAPLAAQERVTLKVAATTDVHGRLRGWDYAAGRADSSRGLARAASIVDSLRRAARDRVILVDAGDLLQGNAMTFVAGRVDSLAPHPVVAAMNLMRYDAAAVGNHEFNYGLGVFDRAVAQARFPFLAANTRRLDGGHQYPGRTLVTRGGVKVAIIGATTPGSMVWDRDNLRGRLEVGDIVAALPAQVDSARAEGADVVIVVAHAGLDELTSYDTIATGLPAENPMARVAREVAGIDAIVIGHSHREMTDSTINGVLMVQPRNWATSVSVVTLELERRGGRWALASKRGETVQAAGWPEQRAIVRAVERAHQAAVRYSTAVIGRTGVAWITDSSRMVDRPMIDLIQEVQRRESGAELSFASVFTTEARFEAGNITVERLVALYPYENTLRALKLSGAQIRAHLEHTNRYWVVERAADGSFTVRNDPAIPGYNYDVLQGLDYTVDLSRPMGQRITKLERDGRPVADTDSFTVALNSYRASGGGGYDMLRGAPVVYEGGREIRELIIEDIRRRGTLEPGDVFVKNWEVLPPRPSLRLIAMNDMHGAFRPRPVGSLGNRGGFAHIATMVREAQAECAPLCATLVLSGGDLFTGTPPSDLTKGALVVPVLNAIGFAAHALGNHEFDYGQDTLRVRMRQLTAPVLGANVTYADGRDVEWIANDTLLDTPVGKVGIVGIADPATPRTTMPRHVADLRFTPPVPVIQRSAAALRARGAQMVVVVAHLGGFCNVGDPDDCRGEIFEVARELPPGTVDAIVSGHTHSAVGTVVNGILIVQARSSTGALGIVDLDPSRRTPPRRPLLRDVVSDRIVPDPAVEPLVAQAVAAVRHIVWDTIVTSEARFPREGAQYALGNLIADAQRAAGNGDMAVMNNGGIRAELRAGAVTYGDLHEIAPFANRLVAITVRGDALRRYIESLVDGARINVHVSGITVDYDPDAPAGRRVRRVLMADGRPLADRRNYRIVMSDFIASGGDGVGLSGGSAPEELGIVDLDALIAHLRRVPGGRLTMTEALAAPRIRSLR